MNPLQPVIQILFLEDFIFSTQNYSKLENRLGPFYTVDMTDSHVDHPFDSDRKLSNINPSRVTSQPPSQLDASLRETTLSSEPLYSGRIISVRRETVQLPDGRVGQREIVDHAPAVVVLAYEQGGLHLIRQYRKPIESVLIETPAGLIDPNEDPLTAAQRELKEETGFTAQNWTFLLKGYPTPGFCNELYYLYLAQGLEKGKTQFDADEYLEPFFMPMSAIGAAIESGDIIDIKTILGYMTLLTRPELLLS